MRKRNTVGFCHDFDWLKNMTKSRKGNLFTAKGLYHKFWITFKYKGGTFYFQSKRNSLRCYQGFNHVWRKEERNLFLQRSNGLTLVVPYHHTQSCFADILECRSIKVYLPRVWRRGRPSTLYGNMSGNWWWGCAVCCAEIWSVCCAFEAMKLGNLHSSLLSDFCETR